MTWLITWQVNDEFARKRSRFVTPIWIHGRCWIGLIGDVYEFSRKTALLPNESLILQTNSTKRVVVVFDAVFNPLIHVGNAPVS